MTQEKKRPRTVISLRNTDGKPSRPIEEQLRETKELFPGIKILPEDPTAPVTVRFKP